MTAVEIIPVDGLPEVRRGDDLAALLAPALKRTGLRDGDVLCLSTKVVSKALGLVVAPEQREAAVEAGTVRTVARRRHTRVVTTVAQIPSGPVMAAAGVDSSNAPEGPLLLPEDPDECAADLHHRLTASLGMHLGIVLTDTSSRVWRVGVGDIALGTAGVASLQDLRGGTDASGRSLTVTVRNLADELAAAADLVKAKAGGVPLAIVRGVPGAVACGRDAVPARQLSRTGADDWFRRPSLESVWAALGLSAEQEPIARMSPEEDRVRIARALEVALLPRPDGRDRSATAQLRGTHRIVVTPGGSSWQDGLEAGALAERVRTALGAESIAAPLPAVQVQIQAPDQQEDHP